MIMKQVTFLLFFATLLLFSCNNSNKKQKDNSEAKTEQSKSYENKDIDIDENISKSKSESYYDGFLINSKELDFIIINEPLPEPIPDFISYQMYEKLEYEEGVEYIYNYFSITDNKNEVIRAQLNDGIVTNIFVLSDVAQTEEGIGIGASLDDICGVYLDIELYYTYESDIFFAETPKYPDVQFVISEDSYKYDKKDLTNSDLVEVKPEDFDEKAKIVEIRMF